MSRLTQSEQVVIVYDQIISLVAKIDMTLTREQMGELIDRLIPEAARYPDEWVGLALQTFINTIRAYDHDSNS